MRNKRLISICTFATLMICSSYTYANTEKNYSVTRLAGSNRYETSIKISEEYQKNTEINGVILSLGDNFPDALSGSVLSNKFKMPVVLSGADVKGSQSAISYIEKNLSKDKTVYILGGTGGIKAEVEEKLKDLGYTTKRLGGKDRFDTNNEIVKEFDVKEGTPVVIANGINFPDALSISAVAGAKGYPILLVSKDNIPSTVKQRLEEIKPSQVFVIGGVGAVSDKVMETINHITGKNANRIWGKDRYDTSLAIAKEFDLKGDTVTFANGLNFPDALSGSALSSLKNAPLLLIDNNDVSKQREYVDKTCYTKEIFYGGKGAVTDKTVSALSKIEKSTDQSTEQSYPMPKEEKKSNVSVTIDNDYKGTNTTVQCDKVWTLTFSEPVNVKDLDIRMAGYGNRDGHMGFHFYPLEAQKNKFVFKQIAPNKVQVIKGHIGHICDINGKYTGEDILENDGYYNGTYRIVVGKDSKTKSGKTIGKDYIFQYKTTGAIG